MLPLSFLFWNVRSLTADTPVALSIFNPQPTFLVWLRRGPPLLTYCRLFLLTIALPSAVVVQLAMAALHCMSPLPVLLLLLSGAPALMGTTFGFAIHLPLLLSPLSILQCAISPRREVVPVPSPALHHLMSVFLRIAWRLVHLVVCCSLAISMPGQAPYQNPEKLLFVLLLLLIAFVFPLISASIRLAVHFYLSFPIPCSSFSTDVPLAIAPLCPAMAFLLAVWLIMLSLRCMCFNYHHILRSNLWFPNLITHPCS